MVNALDPIVEEQLNTIKGKGLRANEQELNLTENTQIYTGLYENNISRDQLAHKIIDQWNISDSKDYFSDPEQIQKANSFAEFIIKEKKTKEHTEEMEEAKTEEMEEKVIKMEELTNMLEDKPENAEKNAEKIVKQAKTRVMTTINKYTEKIKEIKTANETEKEQLKKELENIKAELKKEKNNYDKTKEDFFAKTNYEVEKFGKEDLGKVPTQWIRYTNRENKLFNAPTRTKMKTLRRNITIKKLIKKFNKIGNNEKNGIRFIMGFEKTRFLRYTGVKVNSAMDKAWWAMGMQMDPQQFHTTFNAGRKNIFAILDANTGDTLQEWEKEIITALKKRINYYGYAYAKERANARVNPFVEAEKIANENEKILISEKKTAKKTPITPSKENQKIAA